MFSRVRSFVSNKLLFANPQTNDKKKNNYFASNFCFPFESLPCEIQLQIFQELDLESLKQCQKTSTHFRYLSQESLNSRERMLRILSQPLSAIKLVCQDTEMKKILFAFIVEHKNCIDPQIILNFRKINKEYEIITNEILEEISYPTDLELFDAIELELNNKSHQFSEEDKSLIRTMTKYKEFKNNPELKNNFTVYETGYRGHLTQLVNKHISEEKLLNKYKLVLKNGR